MLPVRQNHFYLLTLYTVISTNPAGISVRCACIMSHMFSYVLISLFQNTVVCSTLHACHNHTVPVPRRFLVASTWISYRSFGPSMKKNKVHRHRLASLIHRRPRMILASQSHLALSTSRCPPGKCFSMPCRSCHS